MKFPSAISLRSDRFAANQAAQLAAIEPVRAAASAASAGGDARARARHTDRGKPLPRDRVSRLLDPG